MKFANYIIYIVAVFYLACSGCNPKPSPTVIGFWSPSESSKGTLDGANVSVPVYLKLKEGGRCSFSIPIYPGDETVTGGGNWLMFKGRYVHVHSQSGSMLSFSTNKDGGLSYGWGDPDWRTDIVLIKDPSGVQPDEEN